MPVTETVAMISVILTLVVGFVTILRAALEHLRRSRTEKLQAELYNKVLDKFGSNQEILAWLQSETGQAILKTPEQTKPAAYSRILNSAQFGLLGAVLGIGVLITAQVLQGQDREAAGIVGGLILAAGIGLLVGGAATYVLSRKFGLINGADH